jgi:hypothetical protein
MAGVNMPAQLRGELDSDMADGDVTPGDLHNELGRSAARSFVADACFLPDTAGLILEFELLGISDAEGLAEAWQTLQDADASVAVGGIRASSTKVKGKYRLRVDLHFGSAHRPASSET